MSSCCARRKDFRKTIWSVYSLEIDAIERHVFQAEAGVVLACGKLRR